MAAFPSAGNPLHWRGLVETREFYGLYEIRLGDEFDPRQGRLFYKSEIPLAVLQAARGTEAFQVFLDFSQFPFWRVAPVAGPENAIRVEALDLRFGNPTEPGFVATVILNSGQPVRAWFEFGNPRPR